jgi:hypothetical protein
MKEARLENMVNEIGTFVNNEFKKEFFTFIYGSNAYGVDTPKSDLDFVTVSRSYTHKNLSNLLDFAFGLFKKHGMVFDDEVPHDKKLLADYGSLECALSGTGFVRGSGRMYVPPVVKTSEFLGSDEMVWRLLLNAITSKNIFVTGDHCRYMHKRLEALANMVGFMYLIEGVEIFTPENFVQVLIRSGERQGEQYLGYKDTPTIRDYLDKTFRIQFAHMAACGTLCYEGRSSAYRADKQWLHNLLRSI